MLTPTQAANRLAHITLTANKHRHSNRQNEAVVRMIERIDTATAASCAFASNTLTGEISAAAAHRHLTPPHWFHLSLQCLRRPGLPLLVTLTTQWAGSVSSFSLSLSEEDSPLVTGHAKLLKLVGFWVSTLVLVVYIGKLLSHVK